MSVFNACIVQTTSLPYDKEANLRRALTKMEEAKAKGTDLILFPEMFLTGYLIKDKLRELAEDLETGEALAVLKAKAKELNMGVIVGLPALTDPNGKPHNTVVMIDRDGTIAGAAHKTHMFGGEEKMFDPGDSHKAFDTSFGRMGILVCYDGEFPETARTLALAQSLHGLIQLRAHVDPVGDVDDHRHQHHGQRQHRKRDANEPSPDPANHDPCPCLPVCLPSTSE